MEKKFHKYSDDQLRAIVDRVIYRNAKCWSTYEQITVDHFPPRKNNKYKLVAINIGGANFPLFITYHTGGEVNTDVEKDIWVTLRTKYPYLSGSRGILNVRRKKTWTREVLLTVCESLYAQDSIVFEKLLSTFSVDEFLVKEEKQKRRSREYYQKKRAQTFTLRDQQHIAKAILGHISFDTGSKLSELIFTNNNVARLHVRYSIPDGQQANYFWDLIRGWTQSHHVDPTGKALYDSLNTTFKVEVNELLNCLIRDHRECGRRFVVAFSDKNRVSSLVDPNPRVRSLAHQKRKK